MIHSVLVWEATTLNDRQRAESWHLQQTEKLLAISHAYHTIDATPNERRHRRRPPSDHEQNIADGDRYPDPGPTRAKRLPTEVDPTGGAILKWEAQIQAAATRIADTAAHIHGHALTASVRPTCGTPEPLPDLPPIRTTSNGNLQLDVHPGLLVFYVDEVIRWTDRTLTLLTDNLAADGDQGEAAHVARRLTTLAAHLGVRLCRCEDNCGLPAPERGKGATRPACRKRKQRRNGRDRNDATLANQPRHRGHTGIEAHPGSTPGTSTSSRVPASREPRRLSSPVPAPAASS